MTYLGNFDTKGYIMWFHNRLSTYPGRAHLSTFQGLWWGSADTNPTHSSPVIITTVSLTILSNVLMLTGEQTYCAKLITLFQLLIKCSKSIVSGLGKNEYNLRHWSLQRRQAYLFGYDWFPNWPACEILCKRWWTHFPSNWFFSSTYTNHASGLPCSKLPRFRYEAGSMEHKHLLQK